MATIQHTTAPTQTSVAFVAAWAGLANGDTGSTLMGAQYTDKSVQVSGTFGTGGTLRFEGSNDGVNWAVLTDPQGNALDFTTAKIEMVSEATLYVRPRVAAGDGTTALTVSLLMKE